MNTHILSTAAYRRAVSIRDLTDPGQGPHALQLLVDAIRGALVDAWSCAALVRRSNPVVPIEDNYDRLHYPPDGAARVPLGPVPPEQPVRDERVEVQVHHARVAREQHGVLRDPETRGQLGGGLTRRRERR